MMALVRLTLGVKKKEGTFVSSVKQAVCIGCLYKAVWGIMMLALHRAVLDIMMDCIAQ